MISEERNSPSPGKETAKCTPKSAKELPATRWSIVAKACADQTQVRLAALDQLLALYVPTLVAHIVGYFRLDQSTAEDIVQSFVAESVLEKQLFRRAHKERGKLRSLLLKSLSNHTISWIRSRNALKRSPEMAELSLNEYPDAVAVPPELDAMFAVSWTQQIVKQTLERMRDQCIVAQRMDVWKLFNARLVGPLLDNQPEANYEHLVLSLGLQSPSQAFNLLNTGKRMFRRIMLEIVTDTVVDPQDAPSELTDLFRHVASIGSVHLHSLGMASQPANEDGSSD